jgi:hypothetical protein
VEVVVRNPCELVGGNQALVSRHDVTLHGILASSLPGTCRPSSLVILIGDGGSVHGLQRFQSMAYEALDPFRFRARRSSLTMFSSKTE